VRSVLAGANERVSADEVAFVQFHDETETSFERIDPLIHVVPVEQVPCLEAQRVTGTQPARLDRLELDVEKGLP